MRCRRSCALAFPGASDFAVLLLSSVTSIIEATCLISLLLFVAGGLMGGSFCFERLASPLPSRGVLGPTIRRSRLQPCAAAL